MDTIKKGLSSIVTGLLLVMLFGIIFVRLEIVQLSSGFFLELAIVASLVTIIRIFGYNDGEDRASREKQIKDLKTEYAELVDSTIESQEDLEVFVEELNKTNRERGVKLKLKGRTEKTCKEYNQIHQQLIEQSYKKVPVITSTQIMTRSLNCDTINAKDYTKTKKMWYQVSSLTMSIGMSILLGIIAYKELLLDGTNVFRYLSYLFSIAGALISSLGNGYKNYKNTTIDHISRLTMIVNRYAEWKKEGISKCGSDQQELTKHS